MTASRIQIAGRFKPCAHMGCFDLEAFIEINQRSGRFDYFDHINAALPHLLESINSTLPHVLYLKLCFLACSGSVQFA